MRSIPPTTSAVAACLVCAWAAAEVAQAQPLSIDARPLARADQDRVTLQAFGLREGSLTFNLTRHAVVSPRAQVVSVTGDQERQIAIDPSRYALYRGHVEGFPHSHVVFSVTPTRLRGRVELGTADRSFDLVISGAAAAHPATGPLPVWLAPTTHFPGLPLECTAVTGPRLHPVEMPTPVKGDAQVAHAAQAAAFRMGDPVLGLRQVEMAIDSDYEAYQLFYDEQKTLDYLIEVYGLVSDLTERDLNVRLDIVFLRTFTTPTDPYGNNVGGFPKIPAGVKHDQAQLFSGGRGSLAGGLAYVCGLGSWIENALGLYGDGLEAHVYNQDLIIPAHELGHTLGSLHTFEYGLDQCHNPLSIPRRGGIISYCYYFSGGYANTDLRYETKCREVITACMSNANNNAKYAFDCNQNGLDDKVDIASGSSKDVNANAVPDECEDCNSNGIIDSTDIASGFSKDQDGNKVPDECEPDCNNNGLPDALDIKNKTSTDLYQNGIPDECETDCNDNGFSDYSEIQLDMTLDIDRNVVLDGCQDCDDDGTPDLVALNGANACWAVDAEDETIREYHPVSGVLMREALIGRLDKPRDLIITPDARILVGSSGDDRIVEFDRTGAYVRDLVPAGAGGLDEPGEMLLQGGELLIASTGSHSVKAFNAATGAFLGDRVTPGAGGVAGPYGLERTPSGKLLVTSTLNQIHEYDLHTGQHLRVLVPSAANGGLMNPRGLIVLPMGDKLVVASEETDQLLAYDLETGKPLGVWHNGSYGGKLNGPYCLRLAWDGLLYVSRSEHPEAFHLTEPHIFSYRPDNGWVVRAYVQRNETKLEHPLGFDFMPGAGIDCNTNQLPDACDIASGFSLDENRNSIPDECEHACLADCDASGSLDIDDFVCFQTLYGVGDPGADCDGSGSLNLEDFVCFQTSYAVGC